MIKEEKLDKVSLLERKKLLHKLQEFFSKPNTVTLEHEVANPEDPTSTKFKWEYQTKSGLPKLNKEDAEKQAKQVVTFYEDSVISSFTHRRDWTTSACYIGTDEASADPFNSNKLIMICNATREDDLKTSPSGVPLSRRVKEINDLAEKFVGAFKKHVQQNPALIEEHHLPNNYLKLLNTKDSR